MINSKHDFETNGNSFKLLTFLFLLLMQVTPVFGQEENSLEYGSFLLEKNDLYQAEKTFQAYVESAESDAEQFDRYYAIAILYNNHLYFDLSIEYCLDAINSEGVTKKNSRRFLHLITINHIDLNNLDQAERYFWKAEKYKSNILKERSNDYNIIGEIKRLRKESNAGSATLDWTVS